MLAEGRLGAGYPQEEYPNLGYYLSAGILARNSGEEIDLQRATLTALRAAQIDPQKPKVNAGSGSWAFTGSAVLRF